MADRPPQRENCDGSVTPFYWEAQLSMIGHVEILDMVLASDVVDAFSRR